MKKIIEPIGRHSGEGRNLGLQQFFKRWFETWAPAFAGVTLLLGISAAAMADPHAYPVPFVLSDTSHDGFIRFIDLPGSGSIRILTIDGEEVRSLDIPPSAGGKIPWDVKNASGKTVATGVYLYLIDAGGKQYTGKVVVIR